MTPKHDAVREYFPYSFRQPGSAGLDMDLHPRIAVRVRSQFLLGEYELAAFAAMREVEIRVRELADASAGDIGVPLLTKAFKDGGRFATPTRRAGSRSALRTCRVL